MDRKKIDPLRYHDPVVMEIRLSAIREAMQKKGIYEDDIHNYITEWEDKPYVLPYFDCKELCDWWVDGEIEQKIIQHTLMPFSDSIEDK